MRQALALMQRHPLAGATGIAVLLLIAGAILIDGYASPFSLRAMLVLASILAVASLGQTLVVILGGIDLSIPFVIGFANVAAAQLTGQGMPFALVLVLVLGASLLIGMVNGALSSLLRIHPLIVTLGVGTIVQGLVLIWTAGMPSGSAPPFISALVSIGGRLGPLPFPGIIPVVAVLALGVHLVLARTPFGRRLYAQGGNPLAAPYALIDSHRMWIATFALSALFAAVCGLLLLGFTGSAYGNVGQPYLFQTIAATVIGGTSLIGGRGSFFGTLAGAIVLIQLNTLLIGLGVPPSLIQAAFGGIIIVLVSAYGREPHVSTRI
jgi:ribose transport system permease protein